MKLRVSSFNPSNRDDFFEFHQRVGGECFCTAWWVDPWEDWLKRNPDENKKLREELLAAGEYDGFLIYDDEKVIGWCQVGAQDRFSKLLSQFTLTLDPKAWAITCFRVDSEYRRKGVASEMLRGVINKLGQKGVERVVAFPKIDVSLPSDEQWTGPKAIYENAGFRMVKENKTRAVYYLDVKKVAIQDVPLD